jgi:hypothetical protein
MAGWLQRLLAIKRGGCGAVSWLAAEFAGRAKGRLWCSEQTAEFAGPEKGSRAKQLAGFPVVGPSSGLYTVRNVRCSGELAFLLSGRAAGCTPCGAGCVAASWPSCCPAEQRVVQEPSGRRQLGRDDGAGDL